MELRQLRYFVRVVELGSMGKAAFELGVVTSALSQQISRLEHELSTRLLVRSPSGVVPTEAGMAFWSHAQLALRHVDVAARVAQQARLSGHVSIGVAPTTGAILGLPLMRAMRERYPDVRLHLVETLSGYLANMLNARQLDLAVVFQDDSARRWNLEPLLDERLYLIGARDLPGFPDKKRIALAGLHDLPLILPTHLHGLRATLESAFDKAGLQPNVVAEIDSLALLMDAVRAGLGATIQPGSATARSGDAAFVMVEIADPSVRRRSLLASLPEDQLSPAALAARVVLRDIALELVKSGAWIGASLHDS